MLTDAEVSRYAIMKISTTGELADDPWDPVKKDVQTHTGNDSVCDTVSSLVRRYHKELGCTCMTEV